MAGRKVFQPATILTAADVNNYLMDQSVMVFAGTAARGSAIGTAVTEGMVTYLEDSNSIEFWNGAQWQNVNDNTASVPLNTVIAAGDLIVANGSASVTRLAVGTANALLRSTGTGLAYLNPGTANTLLYSQGTALAYLPAGSAQQVLTIGSAGTLGWAAPQTGGVAYYYRSGATGGTASVSIGTGIYQVTFSGAGGSATVGSFNVASGASRITEFTSAATAVTFPLGYGDTWTTASVAIGGGHLAWHNNIWIGTGLNSTTVIRSTDGITWTSVTLSDGAWAAAAGNSTYVVGGNNKMWSSTDGTTWTQRTSPANQVWYFGKFVNGYFVLCTDAGSTIAYSTDGITWTSATLTGATGGFGIEYDGTKWWAPRATGANWVFYSSTNLVTWTSSTIAAGASYNMYGSGYFSSGTNKYFAFPTSTTNPIWVSTNGTTWTSSTTIAVEGWQGLQVGNRLYLTDNSSARILVTTNGTTWTTSQTATGQTRGIWASSSALIATHTGNIQSRSIGADQFLGIEQKTGFVNV